MERLSQALEHRDWNWICALITSTQHIKTWSDQGEGQLGQYQWTHWYSRKGKNPRCSQWGSEISEKQQGKDWCTHCSFHLSFFIGRLDLRAPRSLSLLARFMGANQYPQQRKEVRHHLSLLCILWVHRMGWDASKLANDIVIPHCIICEMSWQLWMLLRTGKGRCRVVFKKGKEVYSADYRLVSLTPVPRKLMGQIDS